MIVLVRHASTALTGRVFSGRSDPALDGRGRAEATTLAGELAARLGAGDLAEPPARIRVVTSPLRRATETAWAVARALETVAAVDGPRPDARLREVDFGAAEGLTWDEVAERHPDLAARLLARSPADWPGGETHAALSARALEAWASMAAAAEGDPGLCQVVVSHGGPLRILLAEVGWPHGHELAPAAWVLVPTPAAASLAP